MYVHSKFSLEIAFRLPDNVLLLYSGAYLGRQAGSRRYLPFVSTKSTSRFRRLDGHIFDYQNMATATSTASDSEPEHCPSTPGCSTRQYTDVDLSYLQLDTIPSHYCMAAKGGAYHPSWVRSLSLHHNLFTQLPPAISVFSQLTALDVSNNNLFDFPNTFSMLTELRVLVAKNNQLETYSFPKTFNQLSKLEIINLSGNRLEELPPGVLDLPNLKALYIGGNRLQSIPCRLGEMLR